MAIILEAYHLKNKIFNRTPLKNLEDEDPDQSECVESSKNNSLIYWSCRKCNEQNTFYNLNYIDK